MQSFVIYDTTAATSIAGTVYPPGAPEFILGFYWVSCCSCLPIKCFQLMGSPPIYCMIRFSQFLDLCVVVCKYLYVLLSIFFWPMYCMSFELRFLITQLVHLVY